MQEKIDRCLYLKKMAAKFYMSGNMKKSLKLYNKLNLFFRSKDAKNNFSKEDENTTSFRDGISELENLHKTVLCNICVIYLKKKEWKDVLKYADDVR